MRPQHPAVRRRILTGDRRIGWKASTSVACGASSASHGRTESPTPLCWRRQAPSACTSCCASDTCVGLGMSIVWRMTAFQRTSCTRSWPQDPVQQDAQRCVSRTFVCATWNWPTSTQTAGNRLQTIAAAGEAVSEKASGGARWRGTSSCRTGESGGNRDSRTRLPPSRPTSHAIDVAGTVTIGSDCWAAPDAALNRNDLPRRYYCLLLVSQLWLAYKVWIHAILNPHKEIPHNSIFPGWLSIVYR